MSKAHHRTVFMFKLYLIERHRKYLFRLRSQDPIQVIARSPRQYCKYITIIILFSFSLRILGETLKHRISRRNSNITILVEQKLFSLSSYF